MAFRFREKQLKVSRCTSGDVVYYVVDDPARGVQHRLYPVEYEVAQLLDGSRSNEKIAKLVSKRCKLSLQAVDIDKFARQLEALGFVVNE